MARKSMTALVRECWAAEAALIAASDALEAVETVGAGGDSAALEAARDPVSGRAQRRHPRAR